MADINIIKCLNRVLFPKTLDGTPAKRKVLLYAFYGKNFADDLFIDTIIKRYPDTLFYVVDAVDYDSFFANYNNVFYFSQSSPLVKKINNLPFKVKNMHLFEKLIWISSNAVVHIGGSIYQQIGNWELDLQLRRPRYSKRKPFFSISSNFGPYHTDGYYDFWKGIFSICKDICFRDKYSYELFKEIDSVRYSPDLLFNAKLPKTDLVKGSVAVSVINPFEPIRNIHETMANAYIKIIADAIVILINSGHPVHLTNFCKLNDDKAADMILSRLPEDIKAKVSVVTYGDEDGIDILKLKLSQCEYIIATRFHACVLGLTSNKRVLPIAYSNKTKNILEDMGFNGKYYTLDTIENHTAQELVSDLLSQQVFDIQSYKKTADSQFEAFDAYIDKHGGKIIK